MEGAMSVPFLPKRPSNSIWDRKRGTSSEPRTLTETRWADCEASKPRMAILPFKGKSGFGGVASVEVGGRYFQSGWLGGIVGLSSASSTMWRDWGSTSDLHSPGSGGRLGE